MTAPRLAHPNTGPFRTIGTGGAILSLAILAASMLLRLATQFDANGQPHSTLAPGIESLVRIIHRVAASGMGLLAAAAVTLWWIRRRDARHASWPVAAIAVATVVLAAIGPLTPGYRYAAVTVLNVTGGMVLLMACWWLRESANCARARTTRLDALLYTTFAILLAHVATGAAASAFGQGRPGSPALLHIGTAALATIFLGGTLWESRAQRALSHWVHALALMLALQLALGVVAVLAAPLPLPLSLAHALLVPFMATGLVSIAVRQTRYAP